MSCAWPTSSCTFAVSASLRCSVGARRIHSRSGRTPISSEFPCISMNLRSRARYSSGIQSSVSTWPPDWTYSRNSCSESAICGYLPTERSLGWKCSGCALGRTASSRRDGRRGRRCPAVARASGRLGLRGTQRRDAGPRESCRARGRRLAGGGRPQRGRLLDLPAPRGARRRAARAVRGDLRRRERDLAGAGARGRAGCRRRRGRRRDRRLASSRVGDDAVLPLRPERSCGGRAVRGLGARRARRLRRDRRRLRGQDGLRRVDEGDGCDAVRDPRARARRGGRGAAPRRVGSLPPRAAGAPRARDPLGECEGLALGRRDGGDRSHVRGGRPARRLPPRRGGGLPRAMSTRRDELTRQAARLFAQKGYHGTSIGEIAEALGVQKGSLYAHIESKQDLLYETMAEGARAFHAGLDSIPDELPATDKIRLALRSHLRVVADQLDVATVFVQEWRYLEGDRREEIVAERRRYEERFRALFREGRELGELRTDLDEATAAVPALSAVNWAYTWLQPGRPTDELADRFYALLVDGMRGYATPG